MNSLSPHRPLIKRLVFVIVTCLLLFIVGAGISIWLFQALFAQSVARIFPAALAGNIESYFFAFVGLHFAVLLYVRLTDQAVLRRFFGAYRHNTLRFFLIGLACGLAANGVCIALPLLRGELAFASGHLPLWAGALMAFCVFVQASAEELLFRGYVLQYLADGYSSPWVGISVSSLLFAAGHFSNAGMNLLSFLNLLLAGLAFAIAVYYFGSFWFAVAFHTAWNFSQAFLFGLPNSGQSTGCSFLQLTSARQSLFYDIAFGVEGTLSAACVFILIILAEFILIRKQNLSLNREELS